MADTDIWLNQRPHRTRRCPRCNGCGSVDDAYALAPADDIDVEGAPEDAIRAVVVGSFDIFTACKEATEIASRARKPVAFEFLDHTVVVRYEDNPIEVARRWWFSQYGETPEQTQARR